MDPERARIQADLGGTIQGEVHCDDLFLQMYASDASIYEITPLAVVRPANLEDVVATVKYAAEHQLPVIPRGSGSNVIGGVLGPGLVLDFSQSMRRVLAIGREDVTVQPGVVLGGLNNQLKSHGRIYGPDPATRMVTTLGGMLSLNSTGSHWTRYGSPRDTVLRLQVVLADGEVIEMHSADAQDGEMNLSSPHVQNITDRIGRVLERQSELIQTHRPDVALNQAGYNVFDTLKNSRVDLTRLLTGSEGTLGIITEATLKTTPLPHHRGVALLFFHQLDSAARAAVEISNLTAVACDLLDRRLLSLARESHPGYRDVIPTDAEAMLLVEFQGSDNRSVQRKLDKLVKKIQRQKKLAFHIKTTTQEDQRNFYWHIVRRTVPTLLKLKGDRRAIPFVEDIAIPPHRLPDFLQQIHRVLNENEATASIFAHAPQGLIHVHPFLTLESDANRRKMQRLAQQLFELVLEFQGTVSGSHGDGLSRSWFLEQQYGRLNQVFAEIKHVFDPQHLLNPGKIVRPLQDTAIENIRSLRVSENLRQPTVAEDVPPAAGPVPPDNDDTTSKKQNQRRQQKQKQKTKSLTILQPELDWDLAGITQAANNCNGCGRCRTQSSLERMCPMFRIAPREEASPRAKANLMRGVMTGRLTADAIATDEFKEIVDLCIHCHQCRLECPANVDIPKLMVEAKAQYYQTNGLTISDWLLTRLDWLYGIGGQVPMLSNFVIKNQVSRWLLDRLVGIAAGRKLPLFNQQTFLRWAVRQKLHRPRQTTSRKVVYFVDAFVNWNDIELGKSLVKILQHNGIEVLVPAKQHISGMSMISEGALNRAKRLAFRNVESLSEWVRQGYQIITTEPSAALALKHEYLNLFDDSDARLVAANTTDATNFLQQLHRAGELELDFGPINSTIGYHLPCHQKALGAEIPAVELLRLIPGLHVDMIDKGCSGMAGTYGVKRKNYLTSLRMGFGLINAVRRPEIIAGSTECSTCRMQMEQGTTKPTIHPIKILALAYGLMPELNDIFNRRSGELNLS